MTTATIYPGVVIDVGASGLVSVTPEMIALRNQTVAAAGQAAADRTQTGLDRTATGQDRTAVAADRVQTGLDRTQTGLDAVATAADRVQTGLDRVATAADRVQTGLDRTQTGLDRAAVATDRGLAQTARTEAVAAAPVATGARDQALIYRDQAAVYAGSFGPGIILNQSDQSIPAGWWDTGLRQTVTDSLFGGTSTMALISNWSVASLYTGGIATAFFDFTTTARQLQDTVGTVLTTPGQSVGLVRDAISPLTFGATIVTNGDFAADANWTKGTGWTISSGTANKAAGTAASLLQAITLTAGRTYRIAGTATVTAGTVTPRFTGGTLAAGTAISAGGNFEQYVTAATGNTTLDFLANSTFAGTLDNITVQEALGVVAVQPSASLRPVWRNDPIPGGARNSGALRFDLVDDTLPFILPAAVDGELWILGRSGSFRETRLAALGATITVGPTGTLSTPGILRAVGDVVAMGFRAGAMTADEWLRLKRRYRAEGAKGELIAGANMILNGTFDADIANWNQPFPARGPVSWSAGTIRIEEAAAGSNNFVEQVITTVTGSPYLLRAQAVEAVNAAARIYVGVGSGSSALGAALLASGATGQLSLVFVASGTSTRVNLNPLNSNAAGAFVRFDNVTVQPLTPEW